MKISGNNEPNFSILLFAEQKNSEGFLPSLYKINFGSKNRRKFSYFAKQI